MRSLVLPGWGQMRAGNKKHALAFGVQCGLFAALSTATAIYQRTLRRKYEDSRDRYDMEVAFRRGEEVYGGASALAGITVALWVCNLADVLMITSGPKEENGKREKH